MFQKEIWMSALEETKTNGKGEVAFGEIKGRISGAVKGHASSCGIAVK